MRSCRTRPPVSSTPRRAVPSWKTCQRTRGRGSVRHGRIKHTIEKLSSIHLYINKVALSTSVWRRSCRDRCRRRRCPGSPQGSARSPGPMPPAGGPGLNLVHPRSPGFSTYFIRVTPGSGGVSLDTEVAQRLKVGCPTSPGSPGHPAAPRKERPANSGGSGGRSGSGQTPGRIIELALFSQRPQDAQELVHQHAERLHLGQGVGRARL
jgi:hypothetical protein